MIGKLENRSQHFSVQTLNKLSMKPNLDTGTLLQMLSRRPKEEIKLALMHLMSKGNIDFEDLVTSYTQLQQTLIQINKDKLCEASACIIGHFFRQ